MSTVPTARLTGYALAATAARLADEMVGLTVVLLVLARTGSSALAGFTVAGYTLPAVLTGPLLGAWLGRARRPRLALAGGELLLAGVLVALVLLAGRVPGPVLVLLTALAGAGLPLTSGGFSSLVPALTSGFARANTVDALTFNLSALAGPALAGLPASLFGPAWAALAAAALAVLAVPPTLALRVRNATATPDSPVPTAVGPLDPLLPTSSGPPNTPVPTAVGTSDSLLRTVREGLGHLARTPPLRAVTVASVLSLGCAGLLVVALPARTEQLGAGKEAAGFVWAAIELGAGLAVLLVGPRLRDRRPDRVAVGAIALYGLALACWPLAGSLVVFAGLALLTGFVEGPLLPAVFAARRRYSPDRLLAQVSTTGASLKIGCFALGSAAGGLLVPVFGPVPLFLLAAAGQLVAAGLGLLTGRAATPACSRPV